jgi:hypothetical protein
MLGASARIEPQSKQRLLGHEVLRLPQSTAHGYFS